VISIAGSMSNNTLNSGSYTIAGGCAAGDKGTVTGFIAPSFTEHYSGTFVSISNVAITTAIFSTRSGPDTAGLHHLSGTVSFTGSPCFTTGIITAGDISGSYMLIKISIDNGGSVTFGGYQIDSTGLTLSGA